MDVPAGLTAGWRAALADHFGLDSMRRLSGFLSEEKRLGKVIYPPDRQVFGAFEHTPLEQVKVVILGQDPYHGPGQAHGLCFSVSPGVPVPPSLRNIYKELHADLGLPIPDHGDLRPWAAQGVLLLNSVLTVSAAQAGSHSGRGWELFTDRVIEVLNEREGLVFLLWGAYAQRKGAMIDGVRHCILTAPHPSPLSAHRGFLGCGHFSRANEYLCSRQKVPVDWRLPQASSVDSSRG